MNSEVLSNTFRKLRIYKRRTLKFDLISAIVVFFVAIPLCLGIALASGAPLFSGILSGIVGGIVVGSISGSQVSVSGPAAGMAALVLGIIAHLGDFNTFLLALTLAGALQIIFGSLRAGFVADYVPSNIIQGLLCAIGLLLIVKQLPLAFTLSANLAELKMHLLEQSESFTVTPFLNLYHHLNHGAMIISMSAFAILIYFDKTTVKWLKVVPGPIVVVVFGVLLNEFFLLSDSYLAQTSPQLVNIPQHDGFTDFYTQMNGPNWSAWKNPEIYLYAAILAIVASLESLLNVKAGEKLDKKRRYCSKNKELFAQGFGNLVSGLIGGIPVTSVIVRTSVNIQTGAKTKLSTIFHGIFILSTVILIPQTLNKIPLSTLAAVLIHTGYKLTKPKVYQSVYKQGIDRFIPFAATLIGILAFNLLEGILIGLVINLFFVLKSSSQARLDIIKEIYPNGVTNRLVLPQQITFLNKASLTEELDSIPKNSQLIIDARYSTYVDKEIVEFIKEFKNEQAPQKNISLNLIGFKDNYNIHNYIDFINVTTYDVQTTLLPQQVLCILQEGNHRFNHDTRIHRSVKSDIRHSAATQHPIAVVLGCIDSRVPVETIFDMSFGDLFCVRIAGNVVNNDVLASIEYACHVVGAKLIVVLGHTRCGAIQAACDGVESGHITELLAKIKPSVAAEIHTTKDRTGHNLGFVRNVTKINIANTLLQVYNKSSILRSMTNQGDIGMVGALYDVSSGEVHFEDFSKAIDLLDEPKQPLLTEKLTNLLKSAKKTDITKTPVKRSKIKRNKKNQPTV